MQRKLSTVVVALGLLLGGTSVALAKWLPVHQIASDKPLYVADGDTGVWYKPSFGDSSSNWQVSTKQAFSHAIAVTTGGLYEFRLVHVQMSDNSSIQGLWDIYRDAVLVCDNCVGKAYGLDGALGDYFKIYVGTPVAYAEKWHYSGFITHRFDY
jgi:hypothetical protein